MLQLLKTAAYFPSNSIEAPAFVDPWSSREDIGNAILEGLKRLQDPPLDDLHPIMYWAVANDYLPLAKECIKVDKSKSILQRRRGEANWLHIAAQHGSSKIIHIISDVGASEMATNQIPAMYLAANRGSRETIEEILKLVHAEGPIQPAHEKAVKILEAIARFEKPGHEETLRHLLEQWCGRKPDNQMTTLELADMSAFGDTFPSVPGTVHEKINNLFRDKPPILRFIANPNYDTPPKLPQCQERSEETLNLYGLIIDTCSCGTYTEKKETIKKIIYDEGPTAIMGKEKHHPPAVS
ncbi:uncharacterized protein FSUBG_8373 [Fusarium subglutinans]|uniref:Ankyrin repeat protein n=1 Tax=Gibberella subglutinans TaxID=42677 RepID=A0A8H5UTL2_GIBSU|nr:uncharacterized protein FSUBG_8373 [Fusarium subglutinans]KAF5597723.1 hypothetical protein FSUBG_8373 [Fusarium subglutinans]